MQNMQNMQIIQIVEIDVDDDAALRAFWDVEQQAMRADRTRPILRTYDALALVRQPSPYRGRVLLAAIDDGTTVGVADLGYSIGDNEHLADLEVSVLPDRRREGIGRGLFEYAARWCRAHGRTTLVGEASVPPDDAAAAPYLFAEAMGLTSVHVEDHLLLELPASAPHAPTADGWDVVTWVVRCPEEYVDAYCAMRTQMDNDLPRGEVDYEPVVFDEERLRVGEARVTQNYEQIVAAARRTEDGAFGGYSIVFLPKGESDVIQDDTLVMPAHRGHRLGTLMKLATLDLIQRDHPEREAIHTWTAVDNHAMQRTNRDFGYRAIERMHEMQKKGL